MYPDQFLLQRFFLFHFLYTTYEYETRAGNIYAGSLDVLDVISLMLEACVMTQRFNLHVLL